MIRLGRTDLEVFPLCLGGNIFGWTTDDAESFAVLDAYAAAGGNFVDTADSYSAWVPGNAGGESETIIGRWMAARRNRDCMVVSTKIGRFTGRVDLSAAAVRRAVESSMERLQVDHLDLCFAHYDDPEVPVEETLGAFEELVLAGKLRYVGASNFGAHRLAISLDAGGQASYCALQVHYNLVERDYENDLRQVCVERGIACLPYFGLARGFLTGKYRSGAAADTARDDGGTEYGDQHGVAVLAALEEIGAAHSTSMAAVALAWLGAQETVVSPIASARTPEQLAELLPMSAIKLSSEELANLDGLSAGLGLSSASSAWFPPA